MMKKTTMMRKTALMVVFAFSALSAQASGEDGACKVLPFGLPIHQMRIYDDTLFVSSPQAVSYYPLLEPEKGWQPEVELDVVVYDFVRLGAQAIEAGTPSERFYQHPVQTERVYTSVPLPDGLMGYAMRSTTDFGHTWQQSGEFPGQLAFAFNPFDARQAVGYGMNEYVDCVCPFLITSDDGLSSWQNVDFCFDEDRQGSVFLDVQFSPSEPGVLLAAMTSGLARSEDGGREWHYADLGFPNFCFTRVAFDNQHPGVVYATAVPGELPSCHCAYQNFVLRSEDDGRSWQVVYGVETAVGEHGAVDAAGLQCHQGQLYFWLGTDVYVLTSPRDMLPLSNGIAERGTETETGRQAVYDLLGRRPGSPLSRRIYVRNGQKYVLK